MKVRPVDVIGAMLLAGVLFLLVAILFFAELGRPRPEEGAEARRPAQTVAIVQWMPPQG